MKKFWIPWLAGGLAVMCIVMGCGLKTFGVCPFPTIGQTTPDAVEQAAGTQPDSRLTVTTEYSHHRIRGVTAEDLRNDLNARGYMDNKGRVWDAYTTWNVTWSYPYETTGDECRSGPVRVHVRVHYHMPEWNPPPEASKTLVDQWNAYVEALRVHEEGHKDIGAAAGFAILNGLEAMLAYPSCEALEQSARALGAGMIQVYREQETLYDRLTGYGKTQGVCFP